MILYVNGDSHTAAAEAVNAHAFAEDDPDLHYLGRLPHPSNLAVSWGKRLSEPLKASFKCDAESAASNQRIVRTTREWLAQTSNKDLLMIIQWSTWERQEWLIDGIYYQITASGTDDVPAEHVQRYKQFIADLNWHQCRQQSHEDIWQFHLELQNQKIPHIFFNGNNHFGDLPESEHLDWGSSYISPYDTEMTFHQWLVNNGFDTVSPNSWHFGKEAHAAWSRFVLQYIIKNKFI